MSEGLHRWQKAIAAALLAQPRTRFEAMGVPLATFDRAKQQRHDCPLVTWALATDSHGFPRRSQVLPGTVREPETLLDAIDSLTTTAAAAKPTVMMDAGMSAEDNLGSLCQQGHDGLTVNRSPLARVPAAVMAQAPETVVQTQAGYEPQIWK